MYIYIYKLYLHTFWGSLGAEMTKMLVGVGMNRIYNMNVR